MLSVKISSLYDYYFLSYNESKHLILSKTGIPYILPFAFNFSLVRLLKPYNNNSVFIDNLYFSADDLNIISSNVNFIVKNLGRKNSNLSRIVQRTKRNA
jgi:hypothetical protein